MKFLVVALLAIAAVATVQAEKNVITLTTDSFDSVVLEEGTMLVEFFAPCTYFSCAGRWREC